MSAAELEIILKRLTASGNYSPEFSVSAARTDWYAYADDFVVPEGLSLWTESLGASPVEWTARAGASSERIVLYLHGGGYICGSPKSHRAITCELAESFAGRVGSIDYRLAPENPFPAAVDDVVAAVEKLYIRGISPRSLALAGDSAGGGLAIASMLAIRDRGLPLPAAAWVISPWTDLTNSSISIQQNATRDPIVFVDAIERTARLYLGAQPARNPLASPVFGDLRRLGPMLIQVGSGEILFDDAVRLARAAGIADVEVTLEIWPKMPHAWHIFSAALEEGRAAVRRAAEWLAAELD